ncbi:hypothetical protein DWW12_07480 [Collinsella sp. AF14-35]|nr:hypothetical protein DWW12_07480 [Collinsella sp. AF14-35]
MLYKSIRQYRPIGDRQVLYVHAPGHSKISGNHTVHEGGHVIADSLDVDVLATTSSESHLRQGGAKCRPKQRRCFGNDSESPPE